MAGLLWHCVPAALVSLLGNGRAHVHFPKRDFFQTQLFIFQTKPFLDPIACAAPGLIFVTLDSADDNVLVKILAFSYSEV
jgi:hypothetical protein